MTTSVNLRVSFPEFGRNYYAQSVVQHGSAPLIEDAQFDVFLIPAAQRHYSNGVIGFNDQFRFLSDVLDAHLADREAANVAWMDQRPAQSRAW